jgi:hypothetical protein
LSNGSSIELREKREEPQAEAPAWELISPTGLLMEFGPGLRWTISDAQVR